MKGERRRRRTIRRALVSGLTPPDILDLVKRTGDREGWPPSVRAVTLAHWTRDIEHVLAALRREAARGARVQL